MKAIRNNNLASAATAPTESQRQKGNSGLEFISRIGFLVLGVTLLTTGHAQTITNWASYYGVSAQYQYRYGQEFNPRYVAPACSSNNFSLTQDDIASRESLAAQAISACQATLNAAVQAWAGNCKGQATVHLDTSSPSWVPTYSNVNPPDYIESAEGGPSASCQDSTNGLTQIVAPLGAQAAVWHCTNAQSTPNPILAQTVGRCGFAPSLGFYMDATAQTPTSSPDPVSEPINPLEGNVYTTEKDISFAGSGAVEYRRFYNSADSNAGDQGFGWRHSYDQRINAIYQPPYVAYPGQISGSLYGPQAAIAQDACLNGFTSIRTLVPAWANATASFSGNVCSISTSSGVIATVPIYSYATVVGAPPPPPVPIEYDVVREDGQKIRFPIQGGAPVAPPGISLRLVVTGSGFTVTDDADNVETYNTAGILQSIKSRAQVLQSISYDTQGRLQSVVDSFGNRITIVWNSSGSIGSVTADGSHFVQYFYGGPVLTSVTNLDGTSKQYTYIDSLNSALLKSVVDESGVTFSTWNYDGSGRASSSALSGGAGATQLTYTYDATLGYVTNVTDGLGAVRTFSKTRAGDFNRNSGISGSPCSTCRDQASTTYDAHGWVSSRTDYDGNLTCYQNDPTRGLELYRAEGLAPGNTCQADLSGFTPTPGTAQRKISTTWDPTWREPSEIDEPNRKTVFTYYAGGMLHTRAVTDLASGVVRTWTYAYNSFGQVLTIDGPRTDVVDKTTYTYNSCSSGFQCGQIATIQNALGQVTTFNTYDAYGQPLTITDPNGVVSTFTYDARERLTSASVGTEATGFTYWPTGLLKFVTLSDGSTIQSTYDGAHRLTKLTDGLGNYVSYTLDALGNRIGESSYDVASSLHRNHTRVFNALGQLYQDINAANSSAVTTTYGYDAQGNQTSINAPLGRNSSRVFDALNRSTQITDAHGGIAKVSYDANDNIASVIDPRTLTTTYTHNGFNDLAKLVSPDTGTSTKTYDSGGNLKTASDARGAVATMSYDALNRLTQQSYTDQTITFTYDAGTNGKGRLTGASDASHSMSWNYDSHGRVIGKGQTIGLVTKSVGYGYTNGNLTSLITPSGQTITYTYTNHRITSIKVGATTLLSGVTYDPFGPSTGWTWGNSTSTVRAFDQDGNPHQLLTAGVTNGYTVDNASRITAISDSGLASDSWTFGYDLLDRITSGSSSAKSRGYTYDANSGRLTTTGTTASTETISPTSNRLNSTSGGIVRTYGYDAAGNTTSFTGKTFTFNQRGRMATATVSAGSTSYLYNALGQLIEKTGNGGITILMYNESGQLLGEYTNTGVLIEETIWMGDIPVATLRPSGSAVAIYYVHADHLGTVRKVTRPSDNGLMWRFDPDTFGSVAPNQNPAALGTFVYNLRFPGQYSLNETGLFYNYFRTYDPSMGRYIESDPIGQQGGINSYLYANGNAIARIDRWGRFSDPAGDEARALGNLGPAILEYFANNPDVALALILGLFTDGESVGADVVLDSILPEEAALAPRGMSNLGGTFSSETNAAGGRVITSVGDISQNDVAGIVNSSMYNGDINIISGVHGGANGSTVVDFSLYQADVARFGNLPGVNVYNFSEMSAARINAILNGPATTIGGFCNSGSCLAPFK